MIRSCILALVVSAIALFRQLAVDTKHMRHVVNYMALRLHRRPKKYILDDVFVLTVASVENSEVQPRQTLISIHIEIRRLDRLFSDAMQLKI